MKRVIKIIYPIFLLFVIVVMIFSILNVITESTIEQSNIMERAKELNCQVEFYAAQCCIDCKESGYEYNRFQYEGRFAQDICLCKEGNVTFNLWG